MPQNEPFWNPYRWVKVSEDPIQYDEPLYHHRFSGLSGRIDCCLTALTPLTIGGGRGRFMAHQKSGEPFIPATSLKGVIRSLAEIVGNAAVPFEKVNVDAAHALSKARQQHKERVVYDPVARTFGYLHSGNIFAGLIQFSDAELVERHDPNRWPKFSVAVGQPDPSHTPFYPGNDRRKFYHHVAGLTSLIKPHPNIRQLVEVRCAPPGTKFKFTVTFRNLRDDELNLLLYCLALEETVTVTLGKEALGPNAHQPVEIKGPMRHKIGGCKPHGGGSAHIEITKLMIRTDMAGRYRGNDSIDTFENDSLHHELARRTAVFAQRNDQTMQQLRAMMIYTSEDPRKPTNYPTYAWFVNQKSLPQSKKSSLKPTL